MKHRRALISVMAVASGLWACADRSVPTSPDEGIEEHRSLGKLPHGIRVMTRNVYVGTDVDRVLAAESAEQIPILVAEAFQGLQDTDFRERARLLAREITWTRPHLIGLQEVSTIRLQSPGDAIGGGTQPAETVLFDYLDILLETLSAHGLRYRAVAVVQNADVEVPMLTSVEPLSFDDVRLTDFDVILARDDVQTSDVLSHNYAARLSVPFGPGLIIEIPRGVVAVRAKVRGRTYRFVNTHLEPASIPDLLPLQLAQAQELLAILAGETDPVILVGDLNTHAPVGDSYQLVISSGFTDVWLERSGGPDEGNTCCHATDLANPVVDFDRRIDLVLYSGAPTLRHVQATVVGDERRNRTRSGLWPSDHGGVVANLRFSRD